MKKGLIVGVIVVIVLVLGGYFLFSSGNTLFGCGENLTFYDGEVKVVILDGEEHNVEAHIESEDNWASFKVDGDFGPETEYYGDAWGNMIMAKGNEFGVSNNIVISDVSITLLNVGYGNAQEEFAVICLK